MVSLQSGVWIDRSANCVAGSRTWSVLHPFAKPAVDLVLVGLGMQASEILPHDSNTEVEQVERGSERLASLGWRHRRHGAIIRPGCAPPLGVRCDAGTFFVRPRPVLPKRPLL